MTRLRTEPPPYSARTSVRPATLGLAAGAVVVALLLVTSARVVGDPERVARVSVSNPTTYQLEVTAGSPDGGAAQHLGAVSRDGSRQFEDVLDHGDRWVFRFTYGGVPGGETTVTRAQLEREKWSVAVPPEVETRLAAAELSPSSR